jgi:hypothetical protein
VGTTVLGERIDRKGERAERTLGEVAFQLDVTRDGAEESRAALDR